VTLHTAISSRAANQAEPKECDARCALCGAKDFEILEAQSLALVGLGRCEIAFGLCRRCGHLQQAPAVPPAVMEQHYASFSNYTIFGEPERIRAEPAGPATRRLLSLTGDIGVTPGRAYEIGCATGLHLHHFRQAGWTVGGCDLSSKAVAQARAVYGIDLDTGGEQTCLPEKQGLDLVLMSHVLEHLYDPAGTVARAHGALREGGVLVLEVPCAVAPELLPPSWLAFEHLHYFSPEVLEALLQSAGFEILEIRIAMKAFIYPVIAIAARKIGPALCAPILPKTEETSRVARAFVAADTARWAKLRQRLLRMSGEVFIWGAGVHTALLLFHTGLMEHLSVIAITDRDSQKWGHSQAGIPVVSPQDLLAMPSEAPIIVSSYYAEREIVATLREAGIGSGRIVALYS
jgi:SAM-dependent methyltransferase